MHQCVSSLLNRTFNCCSFDHCYYRCRDDESCVGFAEYPPHHCYMCTTDSRSDLTDARIPIERRIYYLVWQDHVLSLPVTGKYNILQYYQKKKREGFCSIIFGTFKKLFLPWIGPAILLFEFPSEKKRQRRLKQTILRLLFGAPHFATRFLATTLSLAIASNRKVGGGYRLLATASDC